MTDEKLPEKRKPGRPFGSKDSKPRPRVRADQVVMQTAKLINDTDGQRAPLPVYTPPAFRDPRSQVLETPVPKIDIQQQMLRIQENADPLGFLIAITNGLPVPCYRVEERPVLDEDGAETGEYEMYLITEYVTLDLKQRKEVAQWLGERIAPRISVQQHVGDPNKGNDNEDPHSWQGMMKRAAEKNRQGPQAIDHDATSGKEEAKGDE